MANKITITTTLTWAGAQGDSLKGQAQFSVDQIGEHAIEAIQTIGASAEAVNIGDVVPGYVLFQNREVKTSTVKITVGLDSPITKIIAVLAAGEGIVIPTSVTTFYAVASSGTANLLTVALDA